MGLCAMGIGMAKTGLGGLGMVVVPVMANIFGAKSSTGILLLLLIMADFFGVRYYHMHADIRQLVKLIPSTIIGILTWVFIGDILSDEYFRLLLATVIVAGAGMMIIKINIKESSLRKYNLSFQNIARSIREWSLNMPSGSIETEDGEILSRSNSQGYTIADFAKIPLILIV